MANEMPSVCGTWSCDFEPMRNEVANPRLSGDVDAFELSAPRWGMKFSIKLSSNADLQVYRAWILSLRGGQVTILGWDRKHPVPRAYFGVGWTGRTMDSTTTTMDSTLFTMDISSAYPWGDDVTVTAIDVANRTISLGGYTSYGVLTAGDPVSWYNGRNWVLVKTTANATADINGDITAVPVEPYLSAHPTISGYDLPVAARLRYACAEMRVDPNSINIPSDYTKGGTISFNAYQIVRRS
jgi:hypothetical protein